MFDGIMGHHNRSKWWKTSPENAEIHMVAGVESSTGKTASRRLMCNFLLSGFL